MNFLDLFAQKLREKREQKKITQRELAERLNMCTRTVIEIEKCKSNPKFETVALISEEMDISLDGIVFHDAKHLFDSAGLSIIFWHNSILFLKCSRKVAGLCITHKNRYLPNVHIALQ